MTTPLEYGFEKAAYSIREAAAKLGIGRTKVYDLIRSGDLRPVKPCKKNLILAMELAALLDKWRAEPAKQHLVGRRATPDRGTMGHKKEKPSSIKEKSRAEADAELAAALGL
jgi:excisionase family DNA binding protein